MRTSFHHQPEAQHPKSPAIYTPAGRLPHLRVIDGLAIQRPDSPLSAIAPISDKTRRGQFVRLVPLADIQFISPVALESSKSLRSELRRFYRTTAL